MTTTETAPSVTTAPAPSYLDQLAAARKRMSDLGVALNQAREAEHAAESAAHSAPQFDNAAAADAILRGDAVHAPVRESDQDAVNTARARVRILAAEYQAQSRTCDRLEAEASREEAIRRFPNMAKRLRRCIALLEMQDELVAEDTDERRELTKLGLSDAHLPRLPIEALGRSDDRSGSAAFYARKECERLLSVTDR